MGTPCRAQNRVRSARKELLKGPGSPHSDQEGFIAAVEGGVGRVPSFAQLGGSAQAGNRGFLL